MIRGIFAGRLFTIYSFSQCLSCLMAPRARALAVGLFCSSGHKRKGYTTSLVLEMGLEPLEKNNNNNKKKSLHGFIATQHIHSIYGPIYNFKHFADNFITDR